MTKFIYLIGEPGAGKTTLTAAFTADWTDTARHEHPVKYRTHQTPYGKALSLGWIRPNFGGTDTLGNTAIVAIEPWLPQAIEEYDIIYGEGDRLANARYFDLCRNLGDLHLFYLNTHPQIAAQRRAERSEITGKTQNPTWVAGRATKHRNLARTYKAYEIPDGLTPEQGAALMRRVIFA